MTDPEPYPDNPVLAQVRRGDHVESQHRGCWALVDPSGRVLDGSGAHGRPFFARSTLKSLQALPLIETGAADRFEFSEDELALTLASHSGEPCHTRRVDSALRRLSLGVGALRCGPQRPMDSAARDALVREGLEPTALHNNCSGKHAGFLALALYLGVDPERYLEPDCASQTLARQAIASMAGLDEADLVPAVDGCSAPTYRMPLTALATAIARVANPDGLSTQRAAACRRMTAAVGAWPDLVAGTRKRLCTDLARATGGRLFAKLGGEAVYVVGDCGGERALAVKIDDGALRGLHAVVLELLVRLEFLRPGEVEALAAWRRPDVINWAGLTTGRIEVTA